MGIRDWGLGTGGRLARRLRFALTASAFVLCPSSLVLSSCATPVAPTGGPVDRTAPRLVASSPEADAVGVSGRTVRLTFSERVDAATALRAVTVTPEAAPGEPVPQVSASGDEVVVTLPSLRDSTTYVVTVGTELADRRGVRLPAPVTLAFATGPTLDRGEIKGTVRLPTDGSGVAGLAVFAYRVTGDSLPDPRVARPDARSETGTDGSFTLGYLADQPHFVAALSDRNRNGRADDGEPFAAPPHPRLPPDLPAISDSLASVPDLLVPPDSVVFPAPGPRAAARRASLDLWLARRDTIPPSIRSVRALSNRRFRVLFGEGLAFTAMPTPRADVIIGEIDAAGDTLTRFAGAYPVPDDPRAVEVWSGRPLRAGSAVLSVIVADSSGRFAVEFSDPFNVPDRADTLQTRLVRFLPAPPSPDSAATFRAVPALGSAPWPTVVLSGPTDEPVTVLSWADPDQSHPPDTLRTTGTILRPEALPCAEIHLNDPVCGSEVAPRQIEVVGLGRARFDYPAREERGSISGTLPPRPAQRGLVVIEATAEDGTRRYDAAPFESFEIENLAPGRYAVRAWLDVRRSGLLTGQEDLMEWSGGSLAPYLPPEPLVILAEPVEVRARWETEIDAALLAPLFDDAPAPAPER